MVPLGGEIEDGSYKSGAKPSTRQIRPQPQTHIQCVIPSLLAAADSAIRPEATEADQVPRKPDGVIGVPRIEERLCDPVGSRRAEIRRRCRTGQDVTALNTSA